MGFARSYKGKKGAQLKEYQADWIQKELEDRSLTLEDLHRNYTIRNCYPHWHHNQKFNIDIMQGEDIQLILDTLTNPIVDCANVDRTNYGCGLENIGGGSWWRARRQDSAEFLLYKWNEPKEGEYKDWLW